jgi:hypothetical protein
LTLLGAIRAGRANPIGELDDATAALLRADGLAPLAVANGARHPSLSGHERDCFVKTQGVVRASRWCVDTLRDAGVPCVTLKGPALAARFYGDPVLRPSRDVDLLVAAADVDRAAEALSVAGLHGEVRFPRWYERRWHEHAAFVGVPLVPSITVELHWAFVRPGLSRAAAADVVATACEVDVGGLTLPAPDDAWQLLVAAGHAAQHFYDPRSLLDVAMVVRRLDDRDAGRVVRLAREARLGAAVFFAVALSAERLAWVAPRWLCELRPSGVRAALVRRYVDTLGPWPAIVWTTVQLSKVATPLSVADGALWLKGLAYALSDRPNLCTALDRRLGGAARHRR